MSFYSRELVRQARELQLAPASRPDAGHTLLASIGGDAPTEDAVLTVWNGERWVSWDRWLATAPLIRDDTPRQNAHAIPGNATCVAGDCGGVDVRLVKDGARWLMFIGSGKPGMRRDFATPYLAHAIRTAEQWYGAPAAGWRAEKDRNGKGIREAASVPPQGRDLAEQARR